MFTIKRYLPEYAEQWNSFVSNAKNATFLLDRRYMDYHSDRFRDHSLMIFRDDQLHALLPANEDGSMLVSHQGLTYGGLIMDSHATAPETILIFRAINDYARQAGFKLLRYKPIPHIYHLLPAEEDLYAIFRTCQPRVVSCGISSTIFMQNRLKWGRGRKGNVNRARRNGITIEANSNRWADFWQVLSDNLQATYATSPVHSLSEIMLLKERFPENIILYVALKDNRVVGGTVLYLTPRVLHSQYISASEEGKLLCAIDAIFNQVINEDFTDYPVFDFGISTEDNGHVLNESLITQKERFGGRGILYNAYEWDL